MIISILGSPCRKALAAGRAIVLPGAIWDDWEDNVIKLNLIVEPPCWQNEIPYISHFADLDGPRTNVHNQLHYGEDLFWLTILAVGCGADNWKEIEELDHAQGDELKGILKRPNGIPSHDTLGRVLSRLDPQPLQQGFLNGIQSLAGLVSRLRLMAKPEDVLMKPAVRKAQSIGLALGRGLTAWCLGN